MRKRPGSRQVNIYLSEEQFSRLERYWRHHTSERYISGAALFLLLEALQNHLPEVEQEQKR